MKASRRLYALAMGALSIAFFGCQTQKFESTTNEITAQKLAINTFIDKSEYDVIGTAVGTSEFILPYETSSQTYPGDSGKYGYVYDSEEAFVGDKIYVGTGRKQRASNPYEAGNLTIARLNAQYDLIQSAYDMGGDTIIEPTYSIETKAEGSGSSRKVQYKVTVRAKVIQLKIK